MSLLKVQENGMSGITSVSQSFPSEAFPVFEDPERQSAYWGRQWGVNSEIGTLRAIYMHRPGDELKRVDGSKYYRDIDAMIGDKKEFYWTGKALPDIAKVQAEHDAYTKILRDHGVEVVYSKNNPPHLTKTLNTRDVATAVPGGMVVMRMAPFMRKGEEQVATRTLGSYGAPILRTLNGSAIAEGGNFMFLDSKHAAIGLSIRTNPEGIRQMREVLARLGIELTVIPCLGYELFHIDGMINIVDHKTALVDRSHLPFFFLEKLRELDFKLIDVDPAEGDFAINCLALKPGKIVMISGYDRTAEILDRNGIEVLTVDWSESRKNGGGPHCASCPIVRDFIDE